MRKAKYKFQPTRELVNKIKKPRDPKSYNASDAVYMEFYNFVKDYKYENFEDAVKILLDEVHIKNHLNAFANTAESFMSFPIFEANDISIDKLLIVYKWLIINNSKMISEFENAQDKIEKSFLLNDLVTIEDEIENLFRKYGDSLWIMNMKLLLAYMKADRDFMKSAGDMYKNNNSYLYKDLVDRKAWIFQLDDTETYIENITSRTIKEFIDGNAKTYASIYAMYLTKYPLYNGVDYLYSLYDLQYFPLVDLYFFIINSFLQNMKSEFHNDKELIKTAVPSFFYDIKNKTELRYVNKVISLNEMRGQENFKYDIDDPEILDYINGNYDSVIDSFESKYLEIENIVTKINMFAKSYIRLKKVPSNNLPPVLLRVVNELIKIYKLDNSYESISNLMSLALKFNFLELSDHILVSIVKSAPFYLTENKVKLIEMTTYELLQPVTPLAKNISFSPLEKQINNISLSSKYGMKDPRFKLAQYMSNGGEENLEEEEQLLNSLELEDLIRKDYLEIKFDYLLKKNKIKDMLIFVCDSLIGNHQSMICFPMKILYSIIEDGMYNSIESVIVADFYNNESNKQHETLLNESFEDYIISQGDLRPSEILDGKTSLGRSEIYFYSHVCRPSLLAYIGCYSDSYDLSMERIKILTILKSKFKIQNYELESEIINIIDNLVIDTGANKLSNAKIHIDINTLINKKRYEISSLVKLYHDDEENNENSSNSFDMGLPLNNKDKIVHKIINNLMIEFLENNDVGLDKNLSSEIRHGFFSNLISSRFQSSHLLTELDVSGTYKSNLFWMDYYEIVSSKIMDNVDHALNEFTSKFYALIEEAESWMTVSWDSSHSQRIFSFVGFPIESFNCVRKLVELKKSPIEIGEYVYTIALELLEEKLTVMKEKLNVEFSTKLEKLMVNLHDQIHEAKKGAALTDLVNSIETVRNSVKLDINTACEWFSLNNNKDLPSLPISKVIKIGQKCFSKYSKHNPDINVSENVDFEVDGTHISALVLTLLNLLNNACKYAVNNTIEITMQSDSLNQYKIIVRNRISSIQKQKLEKGSLKEILEKLESLNHDELLITQGGTGLYKSLHELRLSSTNFDLYAYIVDSDFIVEVTYNEERLNC
ncbi:hypothetical protein ACSVJV_000813 [Vibrio cholerae]